MLMLQKLREQKKMSQVDVASVLGVTRQAYSRYERGERELNYELLARLADYFDVSIDYLIGHSSFYYPDSVKHYQEYSDEERQLVEDYRTLTPPLRQMLQDTIQTWKSTEREIQRRSKTDERA